MPAVEQRHVIAKHLREARRLSKLSEDEVAKRMDLPSLTIAEIEKGTRLVSAEELSRFALLYDVAIDYLTGEAPIL